MTVTRPVFLGVDVAGASNTWAAALEATADGARVVWGPAQTSLAKIVDFATRESVVAVAIDAQLTMAVSDETGFRSGDLELRGLLPTDCCNWVQSINSMMAVPVRGQLLAESLGSVVGTIIETHPRASLHFALGADVDDAIRRYKPAPAPLEAMRTLWSGWIARFGIEVSTPPISDGSVDALVCATVALLYHREPSALRRLHHEASDRRGRGPFYVVAPTSDGTTGGDTHAELKQAVPEPLASASSQDYAESREEGDTSGSLRAAAVDDGRAALGPLTVTATTTYRDIVGRSIRCPACGEHPFASWPFGWDSHIAHACKGVGAGSKKERKTIFRERFRRLFR